jgi:hypothetical protein
MIDLLLQQNNSPNEKKQEGHKQMSKRQRRTLGLTAYALMWALYSPHQMIVSTSSS